MNRRTIARLLIGFTFAFTVVLVFVWQFHMPVRGNAELLTYVIVLVAATVGLRLESMEEPRQ